MKSRYEITLDYNKAMGMTRELSDLAVRFRRLTSNEAKEQLRVLHSGWQGENADHFIGKTDSYLDSTGEIANYLERVADLIRQNAQTVYNAEMTALRIAEERSYH